MSRDSPVHRQQMRSRIAHLAAKMIVYKGFGHGITKPRAMRAVMEHNLGWFNHYIFGDPLPASGTGAW